MDKTLGEMIKEARQAKGLSVQELSKQCKVNRSNIYNLEAGNTKKPHLKTLYILAKVLELDFLLLMKKCGYKKSEPETLGALIREKRLERELTQQELADLSGISRSEISYIEINRVKKLKMENLERLSQALDLNLRKFFS